MSLFSSSSLRARELFLLLVTTAAVVHGRTTRILQEEGEENRHDDYYDTTDENTNQYTEMFNDLTDRVESDVAGMWDSAPSTWELEYWEMFGIVILIAFGIVLCFCVCCCCCTGTSNADVHAGDRVVATSSEVEEYHRQRRQRQQPQHLQEPILETTASSLDHGDGYSPAVVVNEEAPFDDGILQANHTASENNESRKNPKKRKNLGFMDKAAFVWKETVSVWGEFLGFSNETSNEESDSYYREYKYMKKKSKPRKPKEIV